MEYFSGTCLDLATRITEMLSPSRVDHSRRVALHSAGERADTGSPMRDSQAPIGFSTT